MLRTHTSTRLKLIGFYKFLFS